jgi:cation diffusion facilitator family transporter
MFQEFEGKSSGTAFRSETNVSRYRPSTADPENQNSHSQENDPLELCQRIKSQTELDLISASSLGDKKHDSFVGNLFVFARLRPSKVIDFYENQNEQIERLLKPVEEHVREAKESHSSNQLRYKIAVFGSFAANLVLAGLQVYGAISSGSLSLFTTMADAVFDPLSNITLIISNRAVQKIDPHKFPSGRARIETAGNIVFCFLMSAVSFILIAFSIQELAMGHKGSGDTKSFHLPSIIAVAVAFCTKLLLFLYCWALRNQYSQIHILWEDHRNDLFINGFGLLTSVGGSKLRWWLDPAGAIALSCLISFLWLRTAYSEFQLLIGVSADTQTQQLITYVSMMHSEKIRQIDTVRAWHSGPRLVVEVDVVMDPQETLKVCHDIAEELQIKLERLPDVERAYVHIDYEYLHKPEHFLKKEL